VSEPQDAPVSGHVAPGFEPVRDVFAASLAAGEDLGAGFCAIADGETVVDLWGGWTDLRKTSPWRQDTLVPVFSTTKGIAALVLAHVISESSGNVTYDTAISSIWQEFAAHGKGAVTIGDLVSHQAGLVGFVEPIDPDLWLDPPALADALAALAPLWPPGTAHGYHPLTWGYLVGELVRRIDGRSLGTILREDFCEPAGSDFHIGLAAAEHARVADMKRPRAMPDLGPLTDDRRVAFLTKWAAPNRGGATWKSIEIPSANGHGTAAAVAALYGLYGTGGTLNGRRLIDPDVFAALTRRRVLGEDRVLPFVTEFAAGIMRNNLGLYGPNPETLAHEGWGGSMALADPDRSLSAAYVMNQQSNVLQGDPRARALVDALYGCL